MYLLIQFVGTDYIYKRRQFKNVSLNDKIMFIRRNESILLRVLT